ncbi:hypothetical protein BV22DRAFT_1101346 [Leucogyrophana mollusca]|uniref:Uncharacterized protein n=1 Tax=Leucogyrophana mollusca TaxID=85980 RepID=A0ACB8BZR4_9AGAM|nr:hypothetical protein BV22DRAFT_1101346 [Leucogyrophana mollusca]
MFFSPELLSKRDSGFGLLWLAATLGSKSAFRKLPKRSVIMADISQLCDLIATPAEPLALRLSSNLMEIFLTDVTACSNSLKRVVQELRSIAAADAQLQMTHPSVRPSAVTLAADPNAAFSLDFDNMVADIADSDGEYDPKSKKKKAKGQKLSAPAAENIRANTHTLNENHEYILASSFDASFGGGGANNPSSSQVEGFGFDDNFFGVFDGLDLGEGIGDELARELGEGWDNLPPSSLSGSQLSPILALSPAPVASSDFNPVQEPCVPAAEPNAGGPASKKNKRTRLLLDARTELTDEELKAARIHYLEEQNIIRREIALKRYEKDHGKIIDDMLWGVPGGVQAKVLVDFWLDNLRAQVEARSGLLVIDPLGLTSILEDDSPPPKRRKTKITPEGEKDRGYDIHPQENVNFEGWGADQNVDMGIDMGGGMDIDMAFDMGGNYNQGDDLPSGSNNLRSSEEPGQARRTSRAPSAFGDNLGFDVALQNSLGSQPSALFPWDNAGNSSSVSGKAAGFSCQSSDKLNIDHAEIRVRGSSLSRRGSSIAPSQASFPGGSPPTVAKGSQLNEEDFVFDVPPYNSQLESQQSDLNLVTLERNSFNFLEYAKMQFRSLSGSAPFLSFDAVAPKETSTAHVASAALYHCLVLGTKDLIHLQQEEPYGRIGIRIK